MSVGDRRERERARRERMIIAAARELAETEGWEAVTTRRLAEHIEYSQPVLYSHFAGKLAIMRAVAVEGFGELAAELQAARSSATGARQRLAAVAAAYVAFADRHPALYDVMFSRPVGLPFADPAAPPALQAAFDELSRAVQPLAGGDDVDTVAETFWSGLHGLLTLAGNGRLRPESRQKRLTLLIERFAISRRA